MTQERKRLIFIVLAYLSLFLVYFFVSNNNNNNNNEIKQQFVNEAQKDITLIDQDELEDKANLIPEEIYVHISGQVNYPGLIKLEKGQRLFEAIDLAGGMTENADIDQINLSLVLNDQDKVYIPSIEEKVNFIESNGPKIININTASKEDLMTLNGVGEKTAESIIQFRQTKRFEKIEDIMDVPGIGNQKFNQIKENISI